MVFEIQERQVVLGIWKSYGNIAETAEINKIFTYHTEQSRRMN